MELPAAFDQFKLMIEFYRAQGNRLFEIKIRKKLLCLLLLLRV